MTSPPLSEGPSPAEEKLMGTAEFKALLDRLIAEAKAERDREWVERANRYFEGVRDPWKMLEHWASGTLIADVVMHEVWKRDPNVIEAKRSAHLEDARALDSDLAKLDRILNVPSEEYTPAITEARDFIEALRKRIIE